MVPSLSYGDIGLCVLASVVVLLGIVRPIRLFRSLRYPLPLQVTVFDPRQEPLSEEVRVFFDQTYRSLVQLGFQLAGCCCLPTPSFHVRALSAFYANLATRDTAHATFLIFWEPRRLLVHYVEFITESVDGVGVETSNLKEPVDTKTSPSVCVAQFPDVDDVAFLYRFHRFLVAKASFVSPPVIRLHTDYAGDLAAYERCVMEEFLAKQVASGRWVKTASCYRMTLVGTLLSAWGGLMPLGWLRRRRLRRRADTILMAYYAAQDAGHAAELPSAESTGPG